MLVVLLTSELCPLVNENGRSNTRGRTEFSASQIELFAAGFSVLFINIPEPLQQLLRMRKQNFKEETGEDRAGVEESLVQKLQWPPFKLEDVRRLPRVDFEEEAQLLRPTGNKQVQRSKSRQRRGEGQMFYGA